MPRLSTADAGEHRDDEGCAYPLEDRGSCGAARRDGSPYCPRHHALCYIRHGSAAETRRLRRLDALAQLVGGRRTRDQGEPPRQFLERLERLERLGGVASRPNCS
jgi:hypothetical protein